MQFPTYNDAFAEEGAQELGSESHFYYKLVARSGSKLLSIFDGLTEYKIGGILRNPGGAKGGYYVFRTLKEALSARLPSYSALFIAPRCVLKCLAWGDPIEYGGGKLCFEFLRPVQVLPCPIGYRCTQFSNTRLSYVQLQAARTRMPRFSTSFSRARPTRPVARTTRLAQTVADLAKKVHDGRPKSALTRAPRNLHAYRSPSRPGTADANNARYRASYSMRGSGSVPMRSRSAQGVRDGREQGGRIVFEGDEETYDMQEIHSPGSAEESYAPSMDAPSLGKSLDYYDRNDRNNDRSDRNSSRNSSVTPTRHTDRGKVQYNSFF